MNNELIYQVAITLVPQIGAIHAQLLLQHFGSASAVFSAKKKELEHLEGIGSVRAKHIRDYRNFDSAESEVVFMDKYKISPLFITDPAYPQRLLNCYDSPVMLYYRGNANLNHSRIISIVGTRSNSEYGRSACEELVEELGSEDLLIVSGLAFGIDTIAHKASLKYNLPTVGVMAHGLDMIYPTQNKTLARQMTCNGGLLTEFTSTTVPDKQNFPKRNRIVAGICDALVVVESGKKGGSLITAELANSYNKDVFAFPGRSRDLKSEGCNYLIKSNKAMLICSAQDLKENMGWYLPKKSSPKKQRELFIELNPDEQKIVDLLKEHGDLSIDAIYLKSGLSSSAVAAALLMLEMQGIVSVMPGKIYQFS